MGYCVGVALLLATNIFATKPTWQIKPDIVVCSDSRVSNLRIDKATEFLVGKIQDRILATL